MTPNIYTYTPFTYTPDDGRLMQEEILGPVSCIVPFDTEEEVTPPPKKKRRNPVNQHRVNVSCVLRINGGEESILQISCPSEFSSELFILY